MPCHNMEGPEVTSNYSFLTDKVHKEGDSFSIKMIRAESPFLAEKRDKNSREAKSTVRTP